MSGYVSKRVQANRKSGLDDGGFKKSGSGGGIGMPPMLRRFVTSRAPAVRVGMIGEVSKPEFTFGLTSSSINEETIDRVGYIYADGAEAANYSFDYFLMSNTNNFEILVNELKTINATIQDGIERVTIKAVSTPGNHEYITEFDIQIVNVFNLKTTIENINAADFGISISMNSTGNSVIVGAYGASKAYIYSSSNNWSTPIELSQPSAAGFGISVSMNSTGSSVIVGANGANKAYIYSSSNNWSTPIELSQSSNDFGVSVSMNSTGNSVIVGTYDANNAYIYSSSNNWSTPIELSQPSAAGFGYSVSMNSTGNSVIVGTTDANKAYIYSSSNNWSTPIELSQPSAAKFGNSVSMNSTGNSVIVGAYGASKAYIYS